MGQPLYNVYAVSSELTTHFPQDTLDGAYRLAQGYVEDRVPRLVRCFRPLKDGGEVFHVAFDTAGGTVRVHDDVSIPSHHMRRKGV